MRNRAIALLVATGVIATGASVYAGPAGPPPLVAAVEVRGAPPSLADALRRLVQLQPGDRLDEARLAADEGRLWASGLVDDVRAGTEPRGDGVTLVLTVQPRRRIRHVTVTGDLDPRAVAALQQELTAGKPMPPAGLTRLRTELRRGLLTMGYPWARADVTAQPVGDDELDLALDVARGPRARLQLDVKGNRSVPTRELVSAMGEPMTWLDDERRDAALEMLYAHYYDHGFINVRAHATAQADREHARVLVAVDVDEGDQYRLRDLSLRGGEGPTGCETARGLPFARSVIGRCIDALQKRGGKKVDVETKIDERARAIDLTLVLSDTTGGDMMPPHGGIHAPDEK